MRFSHTDALLVNILKKVDTRVDAPVVANTAEVTEVTLHGYDAYNNLEIREIPCEEEV